MSAEINRFIDKIYVYKESYLRNNVVLYVTKNNVFKNNGLISQS